MFALSLLFLLAGIPLLFAPSVTTPNANVSIMAELLALRYHAVVFMAIGLTLFLSSFYPRGNYALTRTTLAIALGYMIMWLLSLIYGGLTGNVSGLAVGSYQAFITYNILNTLKDPGFVISDLIREVRNQHNV